MFNRKEYMKEYCKIHKEKIQKQQKEYNKKYYSEHLTELLKQKKEYNNSHKEEIKKKSKEYRESHKEQRKEYDKKHEKKLKEQGKEYAIVHKVEIAIKAKKYHALKNIKERTATYLRNRMKTDINFKLTCNLRNRLWDALNGNPKLSTTMKLVGCSIEFFKEYYQSKFTGGMSWEKVMSGEIHCDHTRPCSSFDMSKESEQQKCFHYTNLQPLWAEDNFKKHDKIL